MVRALRAAGHDVVAVAEESPGVPDDDVAGLAVADERTLLTEDRDFGRLVYAHQRDSSGVIFIRYPAGAREGMARDVVDLVAAEDAALRTSFVVMQPGRVRISRLTDPEH